MINNIKSLFDQIEPKAPAIQAVADSCGKTFGTVKSHWLAPSGGFSIPEEHQETVVGILQKMILTQNANKVTVNDPSEVK